VRGGPEIKLVIGCLSVLVGSVVQSTTCAGFAFSLNTVATSQVLPAVLCQKHRPCAPTNSAKQEFTSTPTPPCTCSFAAPGWFRV